MWELRCFKFFLRRPLYLERAPKQGNEPDETLKTARLELSENLVEEMACEERRVVEECRIEARQKVRWAYLEEEEQEFRRGETEEGWQELVESREEMTEM